MKYMLIIEHQDFLKYYHILDKYRLNIAQCDEYEEYFIDLDSLEQLDRLACEVDVLTVLGDRRLVIE